MVEHRKIGIDVQREAVTRAPPRNAHTDRGNFLFADPHAGEATTALRSNAKRLKNVNDDGFE